MQRIEFFIDTGNAGRRADTVLLGWLAPVGHGELCRWLRRGFVRRNGERLHLHDRLVDGDRLQAPPWALTQGKEDEGGRAGEGEVGADRHAGDRFDSTPPTRPRGAPTLRLPSEWIVHDDDDLIVLNKPAHLASHGGIGHDHDNLAARLLAHCGDGGVGRRPGLAQRLDSGVSGLVPCGKHAAALRTMMGPPHGPRLDKTYVALVAGEMEMGVGSIVLPLRSTDQPRGDAPKVVVDFIAGKPAHTDYEVMHASRGRSLLLLTLQTGRTHQIRAHLRAIGHPLVGDPRYGSGEANERARASWGTTRPLLHAACLRMAHPTQGGQLIFFAPVPSDLACAAGVEADGFVRRAAQPVAIEGYGSARLSYL